MDSFAWQINKTARCAQLYRTEQFEKIGLGGGQHSYLVCVCNNPGISQEQIAQKIMVNKSNVCRQISVLEQKGFMRREPDPKDKRILRVYLTEKGEAVIPFINKVQEEWKNYLIEDLTLEERETLDILLKKVLLKAISYTESCISEKNDREALK